MLFYIQYSFLRNLGDKSMLPKKKQNKTFPPPPPPKKNLAEKNETKELGKVNTSDNSIRKLKIYMYT